MRAAIAGVPAFWALLSGFLCVAWPLAGAATGVAGIVVWLVPRVFRAWREVWREARR